MRFSELSGARVCVWGLGREIRSLAAQLPRLPGARITTAVVEDSADDVATTLGGEVRLVGPDEAVRAAQTCDVLVRSPGVPVGRPELVEIRALGVPVTTATSLWLAERGGRNVIGVTGTNGKSTTATILHHLLAAAGHRVRLAGNIGAPALDLLAEADADWCVVELSSYQIADLAVGPHHAVVTNVYRDHLSWHGGAAAYRRDKLRLLGLPGVRTCTLPSDLTVEGCDLPTLRFGGADGWHPGDDVVAHPDGRCHSIVDFALRGRPNVLNLCAALTAADAAGLAVSSSLGPVLSSIAAPPHRLQSIGRYGGVEWIDDSISTTIESAIAALEAFPDRPIVLIAGGFDRGLDYSALGRAVADRDVVVIGVGTTGPRVIEAARLAGAPADHRLLADDLAHAVSLARAHAVPEGVVLLSPAAPSFDAYPDFEARGDHFTALARADAG